MAPPPGGPPDAKRQRREGLVLEPEEDFLQKYPGPSKVRLLSDYCPISFWLSCLILLLDVFAELIFLNSGTGRTKCSYRLQGV